MIKIKRLESFENGVKTEDNIYIHANPDRSFSERMTLSFEQMRELSKQLAEFLAKIDS